MSANTDFKARLAALKAKRLEACKLNRAAVAEEDQKKKLPKNHEHKMARLKRELEEEEERKRCEREGRDYEREQLLGVGADEAQRWEAKRRRKMNADEGFSSYEAASKRQYDRCTKGIKVDRERYEREKERLGEDAFYAKPGTINIGLHKDTEDDLENMASDLEKQIAKREKYSRRRTFNADDDVNYINERNMRFNKKLERFYGDYTQDIKQNLERGTAV